MDAKSSIEEPLELMKNALGQKFQNDDDQKALERLAHLGDEIRIAREAQLEYQLDKLSGILGVSMCMLDIDHVIFRRLGGTDGKSQGETGRLEDVCPTAP